MRQNKPDVVVITGASAGVGRATAREFAGRGAHVGLIARGREGLEGAKAEVEARGGKAFIYQADVADPNQVEAAAEAIERELGPIDIWVNDAMVTLLAPLKDIEPEEFKRVTEVTYLGCVYGTMAALKRMLPRDHGVIVQVGSALGYRSIPLQSAYCGAKHGVIGFTQSLRTELLHEKSKVRVTLVDLPGVNTPQFSWCRVKMERKPMPVPPIYQPEIPARAIVYAAYHNRREVKVGMSTEAVVWGNKLLPGFGDRYLARTGYAAQQRKECLDSDHRDNLFEPVPRDFGAHGDFDSMAKSRSPQTWANMHGRAVVYSSLGVLASVLATYGAVRMATLPTRWTKAAVSRLRR